MNMLRRMPLLRKFAVARQTSDGNKIAIFDHNFNFSEYLDDNVYLDFNEAVAIAAKYNHDKEGLL